jgi:LemA protein
VRRVESVAVAAILLLVVGVAALLGYNRLVTLRNRARMTWADIDVQLTRRHELIPNLVRTVAGYAEHERSVLTAVTEARTAAVAFEGAGPSPQAEAEARLDAALARLVAVAEAYPQLRADARFRELQEELAATENKIAFSRQLFNDTVNAYRDATQSFPLLLLARPLGFTPPDFYRAAEAERAAARVDLDDGER